MRYGYSAHGVTLRIERVRDKWRIGIPDMKGVDFLHGEYDSPIDAARAVGLQRTSYPKWDNLPDIPLDAGDIENWTRRETGKTSER
jgi:hypothetical protein